MATLPHTDDCAARPYPRSYWVRAGELLGGCYPGSTDPADADIKLRALVASGVTCVINLMEAAEADYSGKSFVPYESRLQEIALSYGKRVDCRRFSIVDGSIPTKALMQDILNFLDEMLRKRRTVYVHCWGGRGRTGTVIGCHLMRRGDASSADVLEKLIQLTDHNRSVFGPIPETPRQQQFVCDWRE